MEQLPTTGAEQKPFLQRAMKHLAVLGLSLLVLVVIFLTFSLLNLNHMIDQLELKTYDLRAQIPWGNSKKPHPDVVILQFDDPTLNVLSDDYGIWPWPRDIHADMIDFLNHNGAKLLLYDIMFVSKRKGEEAADEKLINTFKHYNNVYVSLNFDNELEQSRQLGKDLTPQDIERIRPLSIQLESKLNPNNPVLNLKKNDDGTLFFNNDHMNFNHYRSILPGLLSKQKNIGIINHGADEDGVSRGNPLFFRFQYQAFVKSTALPLKALDQHWFDQNNQQTDADGYLLLKSDNSPITSRKDGYQDAEGNRVDQYGYYLYDNGRYQYLRDSKPSTLYFPYLGLRAVLDHKFPHQLPTLKITQDGHLTFPGYNIPLRANGDFLVHWYNINVTNIAMEKEQQQILHMQKEIETNIQTLEASLSKTTDPSQIHAIQKKLDHEYAESGHAIEQYQLRENFLHRPYTPQPYPLISAWEVIHVMNKEKTGSPLTDKELQLKHFIKNKIIFIGATAVAAYDIKNTPIHSTLPGVVLQANLFDNIYQNDRYIHPVSPNVNLVLTVLICALAAGCAFRMRSALAGMLTSAQIAVLYVLGAIVVYQQMYLWINIAMPIFALVITTTITFMVKYFLRNKDYEKTYAMATTDSMTGLYNHRFFQEHMRLSIEQANRFKHKFSLILIDIDFFKKFNDTYGHQAGDEVLRHVARKLKGTVRTVDVVARYGGEEMAIILDKANEEEAMIVAQKVVKAIAEEAYPIAAGVAKHVTISCGVSTYPTHGASPSELIEFSDAGLYRAKENGRNQVGAQYDGDAPKESADPQDTHGH